MPTNHVPPINILPSKNDQQISHIRPLTKFDINNKPLHLQEISHLELEKRHKTADIQRSGRRHHKQNTATNDSFDDPWENNYSQENSS